MVLYLTSVSICGTKDAVSRFSTPPLTIKAAVAMANNILLPCSPLVLLLNAVWKAEKMASVLRVLSFVHNQSADSPRSVYGHLSISITVVITISCMSVASLLMIRHVRVYVTSFSVIVFFSLQSVAFNFILITMLVILTTLLLEMSDLTESVTTSLAGPEASQRAADGLPLFSITDTSHGHCRYLLNINAKLILWAERSLQALNEAAREAEDYLQIPFLLIIGEAFLNIFIVSYIVTQSEEFTADLSFFILGSFTGRLWCVMHAPDIYRNKVSLARL